MQVFCACRLVLGEERTHLASILQDCQLVLPLIEYEVREKSMIVEEVADPSAQSLEDCEALEDR